MISMTYDQIRKVELLDRLFGAVDSNELEKFIESEQIISKLKGVDQNPNLLMTLVSDKENMSVKVQQLENEINVLRDDLRTLVKLILNPYDYNSTTDASTLKSKFSIY